MKDCSPLNLGMTLDDGIGHNRKPPLSRQSFHSAPITDVDRKIGALPPSTHICDLRKTITASLLGLAIADGKIRSLDAPAAEYVA